MTRRLASAGAVGGRRREASAVSGRRREAGAGLPWVPFRAAPPPLRDARSPRTKPRGSEGIWREIRIGVRRYHRLLRAVLVAVAIAIVVAQLSPKPAPMTAIVAAARDLPAGAVLTTADLLAIAVPPADVPAGATTDVAAVVGGQLSGPLRRGEPLTDVRLTDGVLRRPDVGLVSAPVRLADSQAAQLLQPGQRIDVLAASTAVGDAVSSGSASGAARDGSSAGAATGSATAAATVVAADVMVVAIPVAAAPPGGGSQVDSVGVEGALVVLATSPLQARQLAQAQVTSRLSAVVVG